MSGIGSEFDEIRGPSCLMSMVQAAGGVMGWGIIIQHILGQNLPRGVSGVNVF